MSAESITFAILMCVLAISLAGYLLVRFWPIRWTPTARRATRGHLQARADQEREEAQARIQERRKWWPWVQMSAWDDAYQSISEQAGIECDDCSQRNGYRGGIIVHYSPRCPLHKHRWRTKSPAYNYSPRYHLEDVQPVLDRLDITPPTYTNEGTLL